MILLYVATALAAFTLTAMYFGVWPAFAVFCVVKFGPVLIGEWRDKRRGS